jgi:hypothetical protein
MVWCLYCQLVHGFKAYARCPPFQLERLSTINESCSKKIRETVWFFRGTKICWKYMQKIYSIWGLVLWKMGRATKAVDLWPLSHKLGQVERRKSNLKKRKCPGMRLITRTGTLAFNLRFVMPLNWERIWAFFFKGQLCNEFKKPSVISEVCGSVKYGRLIFFSRQKKVKCFETFLMSCNFNAVNYSNSF